MTQDMMALGLIHGEDITVKSITITIDSYGQSTESSVSYTITDAIVEIMNGNSDVVKAGELEIGDLVAFINPDDTNIAYVVLGNEIYYDSKNYKIENVIKEHGVYPGETYSHYEVHAKRID